MYIPPPSLPAELPENTQLVKVGRELESYKYIPPPEPANETIRLFDSSLDAGVGPINEMLHPFGVLRGEVTIVEAIQEWADEPAELFAHFLVAISIIRVASDVFLPAD